MIDGNEAILPYVEVVIDTRQHLESVFDALHVGHEKAGAELPSILECRECIVGNQSQPWSYCRRGLRCCGSRTT